MRLRRPPHLPRSKRSVSVWTVAVSVLFLALATSASAWLAAGESVNYLHPEAPVYTGTYAPEENLDDGRLIVVTYNLQYGEDVPGAVAEFRAHPKLAAADLLLLQEMDQESTEELARELGYDFVYYPASIHPRTQRNMGNAVLSRAPLHDRQKTVLPHDHPLNGQIRIAVRATTTLEGMDLTASSVHLETQLLGLDERLAQLATVVDDLPRDERTVVAGDFNTASGADLDRLTLPLQDAGFRHASQGSGDT